MGCSGFSGMTLGDTGTASTWTTELGDPIPPTPDFWCPNWPSGNAERNCSYFAENGGNFCLYNVECYQFYDTFTICESLA